MTTSKTKKATTPRRKPEPEQVSEVETQVDLVQEPIAVDEAPVAAAPKGVRVRQELPKDMIVTVKNGFNGTLVYKSKKTGEVFVWEEFGDEQEMELSELKSAKNSYKAFFENNWFLFDDPAVIDWLGVSQYYRYALNSTGFSELFKMPEDEIKRTIAGLSAGQKRSLAYRTRQMIANREIESIIVIGAVEESLGISLIDRNF